MGQFAVGDVILGFFPFSDIVKTGNAKKRPCLVVGLEDHGDIIIAQITSKTYASKRAYRLTPLQFKSGGLPVVSYVRPDKLFTTGPILIDRKLGKLSDTARKTSLQKVSEIFAS